MIHEKVGDIFESQARVLVCPSNRAGAMGAGLALAFKKRHPDLDYHYKKVVRSKTWPPDKLLFYKPENTPYTVLMLSTKYDWKEDADIFLIETQLKRLSEIDGDFEIESIAFPKIGGGLGNLDFNEQVKPLIYKYLSDKPYDVFIYI